MATALTEPISESLLQPFEKPLTAADLAALPEDLPSGTVRYELDNGRLITMPPPGEAHGSAQARLCATLIYEAERKGLGKAYSEVGIVLWRNPDSVVGADVAFVVKDRLPVKRTAEGYLETIPDLVAEIRSKNDTAKHLKRKTADYFRAGVRVVVVIDPIARSATVSRADGTHQAFSDNQNIDIADIVPGLKLTVAELLDEPN